MSVFALKHNYKNCMISIIEDDVINTYNVEDVYDDQIEYKDGILPVSDGLKFYDSRSGGLHYIFNLDTPAKVEANSLKVLRRNTALKNIFSFDRNKKFDFLGFMPWLIIILLVLFK